MRLLPGGSRCARRGGSSRWTRGGDRGRRRSTPPLAVGGGRPAGAQRPAFDAPAAHPPARRVRRHALLAARALGCRLVPDGCRRRLRERRLAAPGVLPALPAARPRRWHARRRLARRPAGRRLPGRRWRRFLAALYLFHRLVALELGRERAGPALLLLCVFPASFFFGAPYSESLFLLASVGAFWAGAQRAGGCGPALAGGAAAATRSAGLLLLVPLAYLYFFGPREDRPPDAARERRSLRPAYRLRPMSPGCSSSRSGSRSTPPTSASSTASRSRSRPRRTSGTASSAGRSVGAWDGLSAAFDGARQLLSGKRDPVYFEQAARRPVPRSRRRT